MLNVKVLYLDGDQYRFEELPCTGGPTSTDPADYGLRARCKIILVLICPVIMQAFVNGKEAF